MKNFNNEEHWDNNYWTRYLESNKDKNKLDFMHDVWIEKYRKILNKIEKGKALDLGCGIGQDTMFLINEGYDVLSTDISEKALNELKKKVHNAKILKLDMNKLLPFNNEEFNLVFANLSTHYYNWNDTVQLYNEIRRILKKDGYFIGRVNSTKTFKSNEEDLTLIENNFYFGRRYFRLFNEEDFDQLFKDWNIIILNETTTNRWGKKKTLWEFIVKKN